MDFTLSPETDDFRSRIRAFVEDKLLPLESDPATFDAASFRYGLIAAIAAMVGMGAGMVAVLFILMQVDTVDDLEDLDLEDLEDLDLDEELKKLEEELAAADSDEDSDNGGDDAPAEDTDKEDKA